MIVTRVTLFLTVAVFSQKILAIQANPKLQQNAVVRPWEPAGLTDSRSPCPLMNTLANHGYIAHDGRGITIENVADGLYDAIHFGHDGGVALAQTVFNLLGNPKSIDLEDLNAPGATEHNASLTREDFASGDSLRLSATRLQALLADSEKDYVDTISIAKSRIRVERLSPPLPAFFRKVSQSEGGSILLAMSEEPVPNSGNAKDYRKLRASKARIAVWLSDERFPVELGWQRPQNPILNTTLFAIGDAVAEAQTKLETPYNIHVQGEL